MDKSFKLVELNLFKNDKGFILDNFGDLEWLIFILSFSIVLAIESDIFPSNDLFKWSFFFHLVNCLKYKSSTELEINFSGTNSKICAWNIC